MRPPLVVLPFLFVVVTLVCGAVAAESAKGTPPAAPPASGPDSDAAARHAKRTACLKEAKSRKLIGAQKSAFLKECLAAP